MTKVLKTYLVLVRIRESHKQWKLMMSNPRSRGLSTYFNLDDFA